MKAPRTLTTRTADERDLLAAYRTLPVQMQDALRAWAGVFEATREMETALVEPAPRRQAAKKGKG